MGISNVERLRELRERGGTSPSLSSNVSRLRELRIQDDYKNMSSVLNNTYGGWQDSDTMRRNRSKLEGAQRTLSSYVKDNSSSFDDEQGKYFNGLLSAYDKALGDWDAMSKVYGNYLNADAYNKAKKGFDIENKYKGKSYDDIQSALKTATDSDEQNYLKNFTAYTNKEDYEKAIMNARDESYRKNLKNAYSNYSTMHAFDEYKDILNAKDFNIFSDPTKIIEAEIEGSKVGHAYVNQDKLKDADKDIYQRGLFNTLDTDIPYLANLSEEKQKVGAYIYNTQGKDAYIDYMKKIAVEGAAESSQKKEQEWADWTNKNPLTGAVGTVVNTLGRPLAYLGSSIEAGANAVEKLVTGESNYNPFSGVSGMNRQINASQAALGESVEDKLGFLGKIGYNALTEGATSRLGQYATGNLYNIVMGGGVFAQTYGDALLSGMGKDQALGKAAAAGAIETLTEMAGMEKAFAKMPDLKWWQNGLKQMLPEASEEVVGNLANLAYDAFANGKNSEINQNIQSYMAQGYDEKAAKKMAWGKFAMETIEEAATAALSVAPSAGVSAVASSSKGRNIDFAALGEAVAKFDENSEARQGYEKAQQKFGDNMPNWNKGVVFDKALEESRADIKKSEKAVKKANSFEEANVAEENLRNARDRFRSVVDSYGKIRSEQVSEAIKNRVTEDNLKGYEEQKRQTPYTDEIQRIYDDNYKGQDEELYRTNFDVIREKADNNFDLTDEELAKIPSSAMSATEAIGIYKSIMKQNEARHQEVVKANDAFRSKWTGEVRSGRFEDETKGHLSKDEKNFVEYLKTQSALGYDMRVIKDSSLAKNGMVNLDDNGMITINLAAKYNTKDAANLKQAVATLSHERTHFNRYMLGEEWDGFKNEVKNVMGEKAWKQALSRQLSRMKADPNNLTDEVIDNAEEEIVAHFSERFADDEAWVNEFLSKIPQNKVQKFIAAIKTKLNQMFSDLNRLMKGYTSPFAKELIENMTEEAQKSIKKSIDRLNVRALEMRQAQLQEREENGEESKKNVDNETAKEDNSIKNASQIDPTIDPTIFIDEFYEDQVPKEFKGARFNMYDQLDLREFAEARKAIYKLANQKRLKHQSMKFQDSVIVGDHEFYFDNYTLTDFRVFDIVNINDEQLSRALKGVRFNGEKTSSVSGVVSRIRDDGGIYEKDSSSVKERRGSKGNAENNGGRTARNGRGNNGNSVRGKEVSDQVREKRSEQVEDVGYHAGDLGKAESLAIQGNKRGTGHFGTGTYFVGDESLINKYGYEKRPHEKVNFSKYNLYNPRTAKNGNALHSLLKVIDGGINEKWIPALANNDYSYLNKSDLSLDFDYDDDSQWTDEYQTKAYRKAADKLGIEYDEDEDVEDLRKRVNDRIDRLNEEYREFNELLAEFRYNRQFADWKNALRKVAEYQKEHKVGDASETTSDSYATVFMKALGFEGVDVRGIDGLDDTATGSVIYDLKDEDLARKKEIGTAKFSEQLDDVEEAAVEHFGTTDDFKTTGYILRDGEKLDFSGAHWLDKDFYTEKQIADWRDKNDLRQVDHEDIYEAFEAAGKNPSGDTRLQFINRGNIRVVPEIPALELSSYVEPTGEQYEAIKDYVYDYAFKTSDSVTIGMESKDPISIVYKKGTSATKIVNDLKEYYKNGTIPQGSAGTVNEYRFADQIDTTDLIADIFGNSEEVNTRKVLKRDEVSRLKRLLKLQGKETGGKVLDEERLIQVARELKRLANSDYDLDELTQDIDDAYHRAVEMIHSDEDNLDAKIMTMFRDVASNILSEQKAKVEIDPFFRNAMNEMRQMRVALTDAQIAALKQKYGDDWHNATMGKFIYAKDGRNLDSMWSELSQRYPQLVDAETVDADMGVALIDAYNTAKDTAEITTAYQTAEDLEAFTEEVYDKFFTVNAIETVADKYAAERKTLIDEHKEAMKQLRDTHKKALAKIKRRDAAIKRVREQGQKKLAEYKKYRDALEAGKKERNLRKDFIKKIKETSHKLEKTLNKNAVKEPIIEPLKGLVSDFISAIDFSSQQSLGMRGSESKRGKSTQNDRDMMKALKGLRNFMTGEELSKELENVRDYVGLTDDSLGFGEYFTNRWNAFTNRVLELADKRQAENTFILNQMTSEELKTLNDMMKELSTVVSEANNLIGGANQVKINELRSEDITELNQIGEAKEHTEKGQMALNFLNWKQALPEYAMKHIGKGASLIFDEMKDGMDKEGFLQQQIRAFAEETFVKDRNADEEAVKDVVLNEGTDKEMRFRMTAAQIMNVYVLYQRAQAQPHIEEGGIRIRKFKTKNGKIVDKTGKHKLTSEEVNYMANEYLTKEQRDRADKMQEWLSDFSKKNVNEVTMKMVGIEIANDPHYWPIEVVKDGNQELSERAKEEGIYKLLNSSFANPLMDNAQNPVAIGSIYDVFIRNASETAKYNCYALPMRDMIKYITGKNYVGANQTENMYDALKATYGDAAYQYVIDFLKDLGGLQQAGRGEEYIGVRNYKIAQVAANLQVAALQPIAISRAALCIDRRYLLASIGSIWNVKHGVDAMHANSGVSLIKESSTFDINLSRGLNRELRQMTVKDKIVDASTKLAGFMDTVTWGAIWNACEMEYKAKNNTAVISEEGLKEVNKKFREIVFKTQVMDSVMTRSDLMRSQSKAVQYLTSFMSEPTMTYNIVQDTVFDYANDVRKYGKNKAFMRNGKRVAKAVELYCVSAVIEGVLRGLMGKWRGKDDDEDELKYWWSQVLDQLNPLNQIPFGRDVVSLLQGYDVNRMDMQPIATFVTAGKRWYKIVKDDKDIDYKTVYATLQAVSQISGVPMSNAFREVVDLWNNTIGLVYPSLQVK